MKTFRALIRPQSALRSPWQADMLFGQLCWALRYTRGTDALEAFLAPYRAGTPPLLFSDGVPEGWMPRPLLPGRARTHRHAGWVRGAAFEALRAGAAADDGEVPPFRSGRAESKNRVSRASGQAQADEHGVTGFYPGALAFAEPQIDGSAPLDVCVFVRAADDAWAERARDLLAELARGGYGGSKSAGYGQFSLHGWQPWPEFDAALPGADGFVSLSNWVPARADPTDGCYSTLVKRGKLGEEFASGANPFKHPLVMLAAGACFRTGGTPRPWYGRLVERIAEQHAEVVHYGYAFAVPARLSSTRPAAGD